MFISVDPTMVDDEFFARDGFHPGELGYHQWADVVADELSSSGELDPRADGS